MTQILALAAGTRVTVLYRGQEAQGVVLDGSTDELARVEVLGYVGIHPKVSRSWSQVRKNEYRCFKTEVINGVFTITEIAPKNSHPMNWSYLDGTSREGAWKSAQSQTLPVAVVDREGNRQELGVVWSPKEFERAAYAGYVGYGLSMSDGYYAPVQFESWVKSFRKHPEAGLDNQNDVSDAVKAGLPLYVKALVSVGL
jgi:hypothetical protein